MTLGNSGDRLEPSHDGPEAALSRMSRRGRRSQPEHATADDALRLAVQTLSAEICWFVANDAGARGVFAAAIEPTSPRPKS